MSGVDSGQPVLTDCGEACRGPWQSLETAICGGGRLDAGMRQRGSYDLRQRIDIRAG